MLTFKTQNPSPARARRPASKRGAPRRARVVRSKEDFGRASGTVCTLSCQVSSQESYTILVYFSQAKFLLRAGHGRGRRTHHDPNGLQSSYSRPFTRAESGGGGFDPHFTPLRLASRHDYALIGLASTAENAASAGEADSSWQAWITPKNIAIAAYLLYRLYSKFGGGGGSPEDKVFGEKFLAENKAKEGVITLASGLQYKVLRAGNGDSHPLASSPCACHYEGRKAADWPTGTK